MKVTNSFGCSRSDTISVTVRSLPNVTANATSTSVCAGTSVTLTGGGASTYTWNNGVTNGISFVPSATTTYTVTGTDINGCKNTANKTITVNPLPTIPNKPIGPDTIDVKNVVSTTYKTNSVSGSTAYNWEIIPTNAGSLTTSDTSLIVTWNKSFLGLASIRVKSVNACGPSTNYAEKQTFVKSTVGISTLYANLVVNVYPNPSDGKFTIEAENISAVYLYDIYGRLVDQKFFYSEDIVLMNLSHPTGVYFLQIFSGGKNSTRKVIIE